MDRAAAIELKIKRAHEHIADFQRAVEMLKNSYTSSLERYESIRCQVISYTLPDVQKLTDDMAVILADAIHNLRVAIEYAWIGAVQKFVPSQRDFYTKFPVGETRKNVEDRLKSREIDTLAPRLFDRIISDVKPYTTGGNYMIKVLHDLDVADKHWLLIPAISIGQATDIIVENEKGEVITGDSHAVSGHGPYTVCFPLEYTIQDKGKLSIDVVFGQVDIGLLEGVPILDELQLFSRITSYVVERLGNV